MGPQVEDDYIETVLTCEGDYDDPEFHQNLKQFSEELQDLITSDQKLILKKVEPWNSVRVTINIPREAALRLKELAKQGNQALKQLGILAVQIGDQSISLKIAGKNNETTELVFHTAPGGTCHMASTKAGNIDSVPGSMNMDGARNNIAQYLGGKSEADVSAILDTFGSSSTAAAAAATAAAVSSLDFKPFPVTENFQQNAGQICAGQFNTAGHTSGKSTASFTPARNPAYAPSATCQSNPVLKYHTFPSLGGQPRTVQPMSSIAQTAQVVNPVLNNKRVSGNKDITSTSPLLVNLLQNDLMQGQKKKRTRKRKIKEEIKPDVVGPATSSVQQTMNQDIRVPPLTMDVVTSAVPQLKRSVKRSRAHEKTTRAPVHSNDQIVNPFSQLEVVANNTDSINRGIANKTSTERSKHVHVVKSTSLESQSKISSINSSSLNPVLVQTTSPLSKTAAVEKPHFLPYVTTNVQRLPHTTATNATLPVSGIPTAVQLPRRTEPVSIHKNGNNSTPKLMHTTLVTTASHASLSATTVANSVLNTSDSHPHIVVTSSGKDAASVSPSNILSSMSQDYTCGQLSESSVRPVSTDTTHEPTKQSADSNAAKAPTMTEKQTVVLSSPPLVKPAIVPVVVTNSSSETCVLVTNKDSVGNMEESSELTHCHGSSRSKSSGLKSNTTRASPVESDSPSELSVKDELTEDNCSSSGNGKSGNRKPEDGIENISSMTTSTVSTLVNTSTSLSSSISSQVTNTRITTEADGKKGALGEIALSSSSMTNSSINKTVEAQKQTIVSSKVSSNSKAANTSCVSLSQDPHKMNAKDLKGVSLKMLENPVIENSMDRTIDKFNIKHKGLTNGPTVVSNNLDQNLDLPLTEGSASHASLQQSNGASSSEGNNDSLIAVSLQSGVSPAQSNTNRNEKHTMDNVDTEVSANNGASSETSVNENHADGLGHENSEVKQGMITVGYALNTEEQPRNPYYLSSLSKINDIGKLSKVPLADKINSLTDDVVGKYGVKLSVPVKSDFAAVLSIKQSSTVNKRKMDKASLAEAANGVLANGHVPLYDIPASTVATANVGSAPGAVKPIENSPSDATLPHGTGLLATDPADGGSEEVIVTRVVSDQQQAPKRTTQHKSGDEATSKIHLSGSMQSCSTDNGSLSTSSLLLLNSVNIPSVSSTHGSVKMPSANTVHGHVSVSSNSSTLESVSTLNDNRTHGSMLKPNVCSTPVSVSLVNASSIQGSVSTASSSNLPGPLSLANISSTHGSVSSPSCSSTLISMSVPSSCSTLEPLYKKNDESSGGSESLPSGNSNRASVSTSGHAQNGKNLNSTATVSSALGTNNTSKAVMQSIGLTPTCESQGAGESSISDSSISVANTSASSNVSSVTVTHSSTTITPSVVTMVCTATMVTISAEPVTTVLCPMTSIVTLTSVCHVPVATTTVDAQSINSVGDTSDGVSVSNLHVAHAGGTKRASSPVEVSTNKKLKCDTVHPNKIKLSLGEHLQVSGVEKSDDLNVKEDKKVNKNTTKSPRKGSPALSNAMLEYPRNSSSHLSNFVQKATRTPHTQLHTITSPGFPLNLTESVQKVMMPMNDDNSPPLPQQSKPLRRGSKFFNESAGHVASPNISPSAKEVQSVLSNIVDKDRRAISCLNAPRTPTTVTSPSNPILSPVVSPVALPVPLPKPSLLHSPSQPLAAAKTIGIDATEALLNKSDETRYKLPVVEKSCPKSNVKTNCTDVGATESRCHRRETGSPALNCSIGNHYLLESSTELNVPVDADSQQKSVHIASNTDQASSLPVNIMTTNNCLTNHVDGKIIKQSESHEHKTDLECLKIRSSSPRGSMCSPAPLTVSAPVVITTHVVNLQNLAPGDNKAGLKSAITTCLDLTSAKPKVDGNKRTAFSANSFSDSSHSIHGAYTKVTCEGTKAVSSVSVAEYTQKDSKCTSATTVSMPVTIANHVLTIAADTAAVTSTTTNFSTLTKPQISGVSGLGVRTSKRTPSVSSDVSESASEASLDSRDEAKPTRTSSRIAGRRRASPDITAYDDAFSTSTLTRGKKRKQQNIEERDMCDKKLKVDVPGDHIEGDAVKNVTTAVSLDDHNYTSPKKTCGHTRVPDKSDENLSTGNRRSLTPTGASENKEIDRFRGGTSAMDNVPKRATRSTRSKGGQNLATGAASVTTPTKKNIESSESSMPTMSKRRRTSRDHR